MSMWDAMLAEIKAMDKYRGALSTDLIAYCRVIRAALDDIPPRTRDALREGILDRMKHFGSFFSPQNHSVLGPTLKALGHSF